MPLPLKLESAPPLTVTSLETKLEDASLSVKEMAAVLPEVKLEVLDEAAMVGGVVSAATVLTVMVTVLLASEPSVLALPAASVNLPLETLTEPAVVLFVSGVKVAE